ncbi:hypothetical protein GCM10027285_00410 [Oleiagrimonas citrea]|jgi:enterobactin synthetase component D|uniref:Enterobactin synthase component D n=1 Tax=Oleiagrimonas citrea TaxID=1665687 RepID=A0A846ZPG8_9GAMM|nr:4'-phosphopantetheinyl transferase superfamily protein [Oleiagrimonas citrea]NKZ39792.1 4'-phosphopantetheinyl transferase superfamily protein [Oleiagrimonas citrea]
MHEDIPGTVKNTRSKIDSSPAASIRGDMLRTTRWEELGNKDPRVPPAFVIEFSPDAHTSSACERYGIALPSQLHHAVAKRQAEFIMGRLAAHQAIERLGIAASTPGIGASREPLWQAGVTGSISHTDDIAAAIAVPAPTVTGVGIDIEKVPNAETRDAIRALALTPDEQRLMEARRGHLTTNMLLITGFSAKESFFKGVFAVVGRYFDFDAVRVSGLDADAGRLTLTLRQTLCPSLVEGRSFEVGFKTLARDTVATSFVW